MGKIYCKLHQMDSECVLAIADQSALGKKYCGNGRVLDLILFRSFYEGEITSEKNLESLFSQCTSANLVGENSCKLAISLNLAKPEHIVDIGGVSHIQLYKIIENKK